MGNLELDWTTKALGDLKLYKWARDGANSSILHWFQRSTQILCISFYLVYDQILVYLCLIYCVKEYKLLCKVN